MTIINFKQECNIPTFSRHRKGWAKKVTGLNKEHPNGYSLEGEFVRLGNFDTNLTDGIYIDCSKKPNENGEVEKTYHLFTVEDGKITLLQTEEDCKGWAVKFWDNIEAYLDKDGLTAQTLVNMLRERTDDKELLQQVATIIQQENKTSGYPRYLNPVVLDGIMRHMGIIRCSKEALFSEFSEEAEKGIKVWEEKESDWFDKSFYNEPRISNHKYEILYALNTFHNLENVTNIRLEYHNHFEDHINFNDYETMFQWEKTLKGQISFYFTSQVYTDNHRLCQLIIFTYDEEANTITAYRFGAYFQI